MTPNNTNEMMDRTKQILANFHNLSEKEQDVALTELERNIYIFAAQIMHNLKIEARISSQQYADLMRVFSDKAISHINSNTAFCANLATGIAEVGAAAVGLLNLGSPAIESIFGIASKLSGAVGTGASMVKTYHEGKRATADFEKELNSMRKQPSEQAEQEASKQTSSYWDMAAQAERELHSAKNAASQ